MMNLASGGLVRLDHEMVIKFLNEDNVSETRTLGVSDSAGTSIIVLSTPRLAIHQENYSAEVIYRAGHDWLDVLRRYILHSDLADIFIASSTSSIALENFAPVDGGLAWINPNRTYYTYRITAADSEKYYFGVSHVKHPDASKEFCTLHRYFGSGGRKFKLWAERHKEFLSKEVLQVYSSQAEAYAAEKLLIGDRNRTDKLCLNSTTGGKTGGLRVLKSQASGIMVICVTHGATYHQADVCSKCLAQARFSKQECETHGLTTHSGESCVLCYSEGSFKQALCETHGETLHKGKSCTSCSASKPVTEAYCPSHGIAKHRAGVCYRCTFEATSTVSERVCEVHGLTNHRGDRCFRCAGESGWKLRVCEIHGEVRFSKNRCSVCTSNENLKTMICEKHGEVATQNGKCSRCEGLARFSEGQCKTHGTAKLRKGVCVRCTAKSSRHTGSCSVHGATLFQGKSCCRCTALKTAHSRDHVKKNRPSFTCVYCSKAEEEPEV